MEYIFTFKEIILLTNVEICGKESFEKIPIYTFFLAQISNRTVLHLIFLGIENLMFS